MSVISIGRCGFFSFHASISSLTMVSLPPLRSQKISGSASCAAADRGKPIIATVHATAAIVLNFMLSSLK
jgi:hypothetical protein